MADDFIFDTSAPKHRYAKERILDSLRAFAKQNGYNYFSKKEWDAWKHKLVSSGHIIKRFGSWHGPLQKAGVKNFGQKREYSSEELVEHLEACWKNLGFPPFKKQLEEFGRKVGKKISRCPYDRIWGSIKKACKEIEKYHCGQITKENLLAGGIFRWR